MARRFRLKAREGLPAPPSIADVSDEFLTILATDGGEGADIEEILGVDLSRLRRVSGGLEMPDFQDVSMLCRVVVRLSEELELKRDALVGVKPCHAGGFPTRAAVDQFARDLAKFRLALQAVEAAGTSVVAFVR